MASGLWPDRVSSSSSSGIVPADVFLSRIIPSFRNGEKPPTDWNKWLTTVLPKYFGKPLGKRHYELWKWVLSIKRGERPRPFVGVWPRGSGKSTSGEGGAVALGVRGRRKYGLYVSGTQDQADKHVMSIKGMLESDGVERYYPIHGKPKIGKHGNRRGWNRTRVWTAGDFAIDSLGLDVAARGIKLDEQRPDFIILDDIDGKHDSLQATAKKLETITHTILPAGSEDVAVLAIQNLISRTGIFTQLADGTADMLVDRIISGPFPAIEGFDYEWRRHPKSGIRYAHITKGKPTWEGQSLESCQQQIQTIGLGAFVKECQHQVKKKGLGIVLRMKPSNMIDLSDDECRELAELRTAFGGIDFQAARFAFVLFVIDKHRRAIRIDEYFSQFEGLKARAKVIHEMFEFYGLNPEHRMTPIWGDSANPQDIIEINEHFREGWDVTREDGTVVRVKSKLRVVGGVKGKYSRAASVEKINDALDRDVLLFRTGIEYDYFNGRTSDNEGVPMSGSRLLWEAENWSYPKTKPGEAQNENPDDHTADGADMMAAKRYALMSRWRNAKLPVEFGHYEHDRAEPIDYKRGRFKEIPHAVDVLVAGHSSRRTPRVIAPRPRVGR